MIFVSTTKRDTSPPVPFVTIYRQDYYFSVATVAGAAATTTTTTTTTTYNNNNNNNNNNSFRKSHGTSCYRLFSNASLDRAELYVT